LVRVDEAVPNRACGKLACGPSVGINTKTFRLQFDVPAPAGGNKSKRQTLNSRATKGGQMTHYQYGSRRGVAISLKVDTLMGGVISPWRREWRSTE